MDIYGQQNSLEELAKYVLRIISRQHRLDSGQVQHTKIVHSSYTYGTADGHFTKPNSPSLHGSRPQSHRLTKHGPIFLSKKKTLSLFGRRCEVSLANQRTAAEAAQGKDATTTTSCPGVRASCPRRIRQQKIWGIPFPVTREPRCPLFTNGGVLRRAGRDGGCIR